MTIRTKFRLVSLAGLLCLACGAVPVATEIPSGSDKPGQEEEQVDTSGGESPAVQPTATQTRAPTATREPSATPTIPPSELATAANNSAWMGGYGCGLTVLDSRGEWIASTDYPPGGMSFEALTVDPSGALWLTDYSSVRRLDEYGYWDVLGHGGDALAIDPLTGNLWVGSYNKVSMYDGAAWVEHDSSNFGNSDFVGLVNDIAIDPLGRVWVLTASSVAMYDGTAWSFWEEGAGWDKDFADESLAVGPDGRVWLGHSEGLLMYDGAAWRNLVYSSYPMVQDVAVAPDGSVWATTWSDGIVIYNGGWQQLTRFNSGLLSDRTRAIAFDGQGRAWIGTTWGLSVYDGVTWTNYRMATSGLAAPCITEIAVSGDGPPLPEPDEQRVGSVTGRVVASGTPLVDVTVMICSDSPGIIFTGAHPCVNFPAFYQATTDENGEYTFTDVEVGVYEIVWQEPGQSWTYFMIGGFEVVINEGDFNSVQTLDVDED